MLLELKTDFDGLVEHRLAVVAEGTWLGCVHVHGVGHRVASMSHLWVKEEGRRKGTGRALVEASERLAQSEGAVRMSAMVTEAEALGFWRAVGYEVVHGQPGVVVVGKSLET